MASNLNVTELDFDQIKSNLKNYLKTQSEFNDYDFEGSGMSVLLDVLAYNTHYNAMAAHFSLNEAFLDSAQIRGNVVTRAKLLGYTPRSKLAPRAMTNVVVDISDSAEFVRNNTNNLTLQRGTTFKTNHEGKEYGYISTATTTTHKSDNEIFNFNNIEIAQGTYKSVRYRVDNDIQNQKFQINDRDVDMSTLRVRVREHEQSSSYQIYTKFESLLNVTADSHVFYTQENANGFYEIYFGDGVTGYKPTNNNIVTLDYIYTDASDSNGATEFVMGDMVEGFSGITVNTTKAAAGGTDQESMESIRFNAPLTFTTQNRAVTSDDYRAIIQKDFANISSISCWGGEDNSPPDYGKVYIAIKPLTAEALTADEKLFIKQNILKGKNVVSIIPVIIEPNFTYLELDVFFKYNPNLTDRAAANLSAVVRDTIDDYDFTYLNKFDGVFRHSQLLSLIDSSDPSIQNSTVRPYMFMNITPSTDSDNNFELNYTSPFNVGKTSESIITSTGFDMAGETHYFNDVEVPGLSERRVIIYKIVANTKVVVIADAGSVYPSTGKVVLNNFRADTANAIKITVVPDSLDLAPKRDQLISINSNFVTITPEIDTIALQGSSGTIDYTTTSRTR